MGEVRLDDAVERALGELRAAIEAGFRSERRRDPLTGLQNLFALDEWLDQSIAGACWVAFVEVDKFKSINERFGYDNADQFLKLVASCLAVTAERNQGVAFRAHGDEFYLAASTPEPIDSGAVQALLEELADWIKALPLSVSHDGETRTLSGTVSIGWLDTSDVEGEVGRSELKTKLEIAMAEAKKNRGSTIRWLPTMKRPEMSSHRDDCTACGCKFSFDVPSTVSRAVIVCPVCHVELRTLT